jgi:hypothetical protein
MALDGGFLLSLGNKCGKNPWSYECFDHYNAGYWTILDNPKNWSQQYGYHKWSTATTTATTSPKKCERSAKTLEWKSLHGEQKMFDGIAFLKALERQKVTVVSFIGDSISRQSFAVLLEAIQTPAQACSWGKLTKEISFPTECVSALEGNNITNVTFRMHNDVYGDHISEEPYFEEADIIVMNFGIWYVEQKKIGQQTNHTPSTYLSHMVQIIGDINRRRRPHQLIVFRESAKMLIPTSNALLQKMTQELRSVLIEHKIPIIAHQSANLTDDLFHDDIHLCEPALQLSWLTILMHIVQGWDRGH